MCPMLCVEATAVILVGASVHSLARRQHGISMQSSVAMARGTPICQGPPMPEGEHSGRTGGHGVEDSKPVFKGVMETEVSAPH